MQQQTLLLLLLFLPRVQNVLRTRPANRVVAIAEHLGSKNVVVRVTRALSTRGAKASMHAEQVSYKACMNWVGTSMTYVQTSRSLLS